MTITQTDVHTRYEACTVTLRERHTFTSLELSFGDQSVNYYFKDIATARGFLQAGLDALHEANLKEFDESGLRQGSVSIDAEAS